MSITDPIVADDAFDPTRLPLDDLGAAVLGPVLTSAHPDLSLEVAAFNVAVPQRPAVAVGATCAEDVAAAVRWAVANGLAVGVQSTGHGVVLTADDALLVTTHRMRGVSVDPAARTVRFEAGVRWVDVIEAAAPHGLAPLSGSSSSVGAVGYTLGGGIGLMARQYGFAADHVNWVELVSADGAIRRVDADSDPDLFWAVRGGKGNFGIVTAMEVALFPVPAVYGGALYFDASSARSVLEAYREWTPTLPEQMTTALAFMRMPPLDVVPEPLRGRFTIALKVTFTGPEAEGEALLAPMRAAGEVVFGGTGVMPYTATDVVHSDPKDPLPAWERGGVLRELAPETVDALLEVAGPDAEMPILKVELRQLGGALGRPAAVPNAVSGRDGAYALYLVALLMPGLEQAVPAAGSALMAAMQPWLTGTAPLNFLGEALTPEAVRAAWQPEVRERLLEVKRAVDPGNVFRFGHAIGV